MVIKKHGRFFWIGIYSLSSCKIRNSPDGVRFPTVKPCKGNVKGALLVF